MMVSGETCSAQLAARLRGHLSTCTACATADCEEGARIRRAFRAVQTVLCSPEPVVEMQVRR